MPVRQLTVEEFRKYVKKATPEEISKFSVEKLPNYLPDNITDDLPESSRSAIEELLFEANTYHFNRRQELEARFGAELTLALDIANRPYDKAVHTLFREKLKVLVELYQKYRVTMTPEQTERFYPTIEKLEQLLIKLKEQTNTTMRNAHRVKTKLDQSGEFRSTFEAAIKNLEKQFGDIEHSMDLYYYVRIVISNNQMHHVREKVNTLSKQTQKVQAQIDRYRNELKLLQKNNQSKQEIHRRQQLQGFIGKFVEELKEYDVIISETDLFGWLDIIAEASLSNYVQQRANHAIRRGRLLLFQLLYQYCSFQEKAAEQIARNPFSQANPKESIQFMLKSEQFILNYFAQKRSNIIASLGGAAESRLQELDHLKKDLLQEMKKNSRKLK